MKIELTKDEAETLSIFIECELLDSIRREEEADNLDYYYNILSAYKKIEKAIQEERQNANE